MNIGIIGAGNIGATLAKLFIEAGHSIAIANSRGPETLQALVNELGNGAQAMTAAEAAAFGEVIIEAIPYKFYRTLPAAELAGKILVTAGNYYPGRDGQIELGDKAESELIADMLPDTRVVKGFNTIWFKHLQTQGDTSKPPADRRVIFIAGDDPAAKQTVADLIAEIGFAPYDTGSLHHSKIQQPDTAIYNKDITLAEARAQLGE